MVAFFLLTAIRQPRLGLDETAYAKLDGRGMIAAAVIGPIALVGVAVTLIGIWMVLVEWRGRFTEKGADDNVVRKGGVDIPALVGALGKLRGATLVTIAGVAILLSVAWMTSSTTGAEPSPTPTTAPATTT
jgi:hypothetical protein